MTADLPTRGPYVLAQPGLNVLANLGWSTAQSVASLTPSWEYVQTKGKTPMTGASAARIPRLRWGIGILLGAGVLINYFDRINLSVAAPQFRDGRWAGLPALRSGGASGGARSTATTRVGEAGLSFPTASTAVTQ